MTPEFQSIYSRYADQVHQEPEKVLFAALPGTASPGLSYGEFDDLVRRIAARLIADAVLPGDRVAMQVAKSPEAVALYVAALQIGAVFLPLNSAYTRTEVAYFLRDAEPKVLVCSPERVAEFIGISGPAEAVPLHVESLGAHGEGTLLSGSEQSSEVHPAQADDPAAILYTSGTTGRSKGAVLTHSNLAANCQALIDCWNYAATDRLIHALPIFHIHGLFVAVNLTLASGASMFFLPAFDAGTIIDLLPHATVLMGVPTFYTRLLKTAGLDERVCVRMRLFVSGSAPLLASDHEQFQLRTGHSIVERYGMTETGMNTSNPYRDGTRKPGTVGMALPGVNVRVIDVRTGQQAAPGEVGMIEVRGPNVFAGYWRMPEKTAQEFREDGFFVTGDLGRFDEDGHLVIVGREKDLIISGGFNIYPKEIEELLDAQPTVLESAVIGVPHPDLGEAVVGIVVSRPGEQPDRQELLDAISPDLARFKLPRLLYLVETLPRNVMGKVQKAKLREEYAGAFRDESAGTAAQ